MLRPHRTYDIGTLNEAITNLAFTQKTVAASLLESRQLKKKGRVRDLAKNLQKNWELLCNLRKDYSRILIISNNICLDPKLLDEVTKITRIAHGCLRYGEKAVQLDAAILGLSFSYEKENNTPESNP